MKPKTNDPRPAYLQVADELRDSIASGGLKPGERLPSGRDLARRYGVAPMTISHALDVLRQEQLVEAYQGRGVFVTDQSGTAGPSQNGGQQDQAIGSLRADLDELAERVARIERLIAAGSDLGGRTTVISWPCFLLVNRTYAQETSQASEGTPLAAPLLPPFAPSPAAGDMTSAIPNIPLRNWRAQNCLSRSEMADRINASPAGVADRLACDEERIRRWESGEVRWPSPPYRRALKELTGLEPAQLGFTPRTAAGRLSHRPASRPPTRSAAKQSCSTRWT